MTFPVHPADISVEWLTDTLRATGVLTHARVTELETVLLSTEKGTTGHLARLQLGYSHAEADAPRSLVAKFSAADPQARALIHGMGFYEREVRFYEELAAQSPLRTPRCYFSALNPEEGTSLLLLEDLAHTRNGNRIQGASVAEAELVIRTIAPFHAAWWQHPQLAEQPWLELRSLVSVQQAPLIVAQLWEPFLGKLGTRVTDDMLQIGEWLKMYLGPLYAYLYQGAPYTLIHNDYQGDNLFFTGQDSHGPLIVADWQLTTRGRAAIDVACFLAGNLDAGDRRNHEQRLLHTYHTLLTDNGVHDYSFEQCWNDYRLAMIQLLSRIVTVVGVGGARGEQERAYCDVLVPRYCHAAHDLKVGEVLQAVFAHGAH